MRLKSTDDIQLYIDYLESHPTACQEAIDYTKTFTGTMEEVAKDMVELPNDNLAKWFIFALKGFFGDLPTKVRIIYFNFLIREDYRRTNIIRVFREGRSDMTQEELIKYRKYLSKFPKMISQGELDG